MTVRTSPQANVVSFPLGLFPANIVGYFAGGTYLILTLGLPGLFGLLFVTTFLLFSMYQLRESKRWEFKALDAANKRIAIVREILPNIRGVKYAGWEGKYFERLRSARAAETAYVVCWRIKIV